MSTHIFYMSTSFITCRAQHSYLINICQHVGGKSFSQIFGPCQHLFVNARGVCIYACVHACMHACMYVCMYVCMYYVCICIARLECDIQPCTYVYAYIHTQMHISITYESSQYVHTYINAYKHIQINQVHACMHTHMKNIYVSM